MRERRCRAMAVLAGSERGGDRAASCGARSDCPRMRNFARRKRAGDAARPDRRRRRAVQFRRGDGDARRRAACDRRDRLRLCARTRPREGAADRAVSTRCCRREHIAQRVLERSVLAPIESRLTAERGEGRAADRRDQGRVLHAGSRRGLTMIAARLPANPVLRGAIGVPRDPGCHWRGPARCSRSAKPLTRRRRCRPAPRRLR